MSLSTNIDHLSARRLPNPWAFPTLSVEQVAMVYGISRGTAYKAVRTGRIPSLRLGARRLVIPTIAVWRSLGLDPPPPPAAREERVDETNDSGNAKGPRLRTRRGPE